MLAQVAHVPSISFLSRVTPLIFGLVVNTAQLTPKYCLVTKHYLHSPSLFPKPATEQTPAKTLFNKYDNKKKNIKAPRQRFPSENIPRNNYNVIVYIQRERKKTNTHYSFAIKQSCM